MLNPIYARLFVFPIFLLCISCSKQPFEFLDSNQFRVDIVRTHIVIPSPTSTDAYDVFEGCPGKKCNVRVFTRLSLNNTLDKDGEIVVGSIRLYKNDRLVLSANSNEILPLPRRKRTGALLRAYSPATNYKITEIDRQFFERVITESEQGWVTIKTEPAWWLHDEKVRIEAEYLLRPPGYEDGESVLTFTPTHFPILTETQQESFE